MPSYVMGTQEQNLFGEKVNDILKKGTFSIVTPYEFFLWKNKPDFMFIVKLSWNILRFHLRLNYFESWRMFSGKRKKIEGRVVRIKMKDL